MGESRVTSLSERLREEWVLNLATRWRHGFARMPVGCSGDRQQRPPAALAAGGRWRARQAAGGAGSGGRRSVAGTAGAGADGGGRSCWRPPEQATTSSGLAAVLVPAADGAAGMPRVLW